MNIFKSGAVWVLTSSKGEVLGVSDNKAELVELKKELSSKGER